jgi:hypothetical protein
VVSGGLVRRYGKCGSVGDDRLSCFVKFWRRSCCTTGLIQHEEGKARTAKVAKKIGIALRAERISCLLRY